MEIFSKYSLSLIIISCISFFYFILPGKIIALFIFLLTFVPIYLITHNKLDYRLFIILMLIYILSYLEKRNMCKNDKKKIDSKIIFSTLYSLIPYILNTYVIGYALNKAVYSNYSDFIDLFGETYGVLAERLIESRASIPPDELLKIRRNNGFVIWSLLACLYITNVVDMSLVLHEC
jgi:hypothetical protein